MLNRKGVVFGVTLLTLGIFSLPNSALAAGPYELRERGNDQDFPTWHVGRGTRLCVQNLDSQNSASVKVQAKAAAPPEEIEVPASETRCIDRGWGGAIVNVANVRGIPVRVWTE
ncbi:MAG: hypothetical protein HY785_28895 [Oscillatoriophycideae cyanobacterium NC_groundwater_1537_Pr4_S-0.65um_50_18]|nr:hypothetical protein [Oscillatoriophycideae cyanobacterium NC_groundwater_1537_Pr4_S-0.65um_50_18]